MKKTSSARKSTKSKKNASKSGDVELNTHSILEIIKMHHEEVKPDIEVLTSDRSSTVEKKSALRHFLPALKAHAHAEQRTLYVAMEQLKHLRPDSLEGYVEHDTAERLLKELEASNFQHEWTEEIGAKAKVLSELIEHHVREEENEMFPKVRQAFTHTELVAMADPYLVIFEAELAAAQNFGLKIPSMDEIKETVNKSWKQAYGKVADKVADYVKSSR
ncbi:MAG: hemerythrin domain-containing protein [Bdellovibrionota bacterium]